MKRLILISGMFAALVCPSLYAQKLDMRANIPFEFRVGKAVMPPGMYEIRQNDGIVAVRQEGGRKIAVAFAHAGASLVNSTTKAGLQFNQYGNTRFLSKVWIDPGYATELGRSSAEKTVSARARAVDGVVVALHAK